MTKMVYAFEEGNKDMRDILGGKGANLAEMKKIGLPVPDGFTISTTACNNYYQSKETIDNKLKTEIYDKLKELETKTKKTLGDPHNPLLVSVRSGASVSMPGMLDTILNLGLNDKVAQNLINETNNPRFVYDSYRRLIQMFADVVKGYPTEPFEQYIDQLKEQKECKSDLDLTAEDMINITDHFKNLYHQFAKKEFPQDPKIQLLDAITAVFRSWNNERAIYYRQLNDIPASCGTAVNIQEMVFGNKGHDSGTGVAFTRNPSTGEKQLFGEFLMNAQGEDIVAGIRTPQPITTLQTIAPDIYQQFIDITKILENHYQDMQEIEFTIENNKLYILQTRNGKRTATATLKIAVDLYHEKMLSKEAAIMKVEPKQLDNLLHPIFEPTALKKARVIARGLAASPGAATGKICFSAATAIKLKKDGEKNLILVRLETSPEDIEGMNVVNGILTIRGGMTSHAAVVARGMGICCICGCSDIIIDLKHKTLTTNEGIVYKEGDYISLDGTTGNVYHHQVPTTEAEISGDFATFMSWVDEIKDLKVRTNADTPKDASIALKFGAEGIGLCRTEHMFFEEDRIFAMRQMITSETTEQREKALSKILPMQQKDFEALFTIMKDYPVTIRFLDPPLHEFLPQKEDEIKELAEALNISASKLKQHIEELKEFNPMLGHRGVRLAITYPEIAVMQTKAVIKAAIAVSYKGIEVKPEIMIPLVGNVTELEYLKSIIKNTADELIKQNNSKLKYSVGTMIEVPRAALTADEIATAADFFSFGTNDLTQMTYAFSRDDASKFLNDYYDKQILDADPFAKLDQVGVGKLVEMAIKLGRQTKPDMKMGICGEHGGEPSSVAFCHKVGLNYVSCSPYRVPIAKLAAAQAKIQQKV